MESLDPLAELRAEKHAGSLMLSGSQAPADQRVKTKRFTNVQLNSAELRMKHVIFQKKEGNITCTNRSINQIVCLPQSNRRISCGHLKQQKKNSSPSTTSESSDEDFLSPHRTKTKPPPSHSRSAVSTATPTRTPPSRRARPSTSSHDRDDLREEERQKWRKFREKKTSQRSAVFRLHPRKPRQNPSEPSEYSAPPQLLFLSSLSESIIRLSSSCAVQ